MYVRKKTISKLFYGFCFIQHARNCYSGFYCGKINIYLFLSQGPDVMLI